MKVYLVVTEAWFGGGEDARVFATREAAQVYVDEVGPEKDVATQILERDVEE